MTSNRSTGSVLKCGERKKHALVIPLLFHAHTAGMYRLALQLAKRGVTITFVSLAKHIAQLKTYDELQGLEFNLVSLDPSFTLPPDVQTWKQVEDVLQSTKDHLQPILDELKVKQKAGVYGPTCIIHDRLCTNWVSDVAKDLNIPFYTFFSCGAIMARFYQGFPRLFSDAALVINDDTSLLKEFEGTVEIAFCPGLRYPEIPLDGRECPDLPIAIAQAMKSAAALIVNTFYELESPQIDEILRHWAEDSVGGKIPKLFSVGPLSNAGTFKDRSFISGPDDRGNDCLKWLDNRRPQSVLYICIGTLCRWIPPQVYELALALEATEQSFLWVLPLSDDLPSFEGALPAGFEVRTKERGRIVSGWLPQLHILGHSSVGGFLTHCGWNSLIESVSSGVTMIGWPQFAEQHMNCRHLVEDMKVGVQVGHGLSEGSLIKHEQFEKAIRLLMVDEEGKAMRSRVQDLKMKAHAAVSNGGSSQRSLNEIVDSIPGEY